MRAAAPAAQYVIPRFSANQINLRVRNYFGFNFFPNEDRIATPVRGRGFDTGREIAVRCETGPIV